MGAWQDSSDTNLSLVVPNVHVAVVQACKDPWLFGVNIDTLDAVRTSAKLALLVQSEQVQTTSSMACDDGVIELVSTIRVWLVDRALRKDRTLISNRRGYQCVEQVSEHQQRYESVE